MERKLYTKNEVIDFISKRKTMVLSADETILTQLPKGNWIGGTTPYFMDKTAGTLSKEMIFVDDFSEIAIDSKIELFTEKQISDICRNSFENGFTVLILPLGADVYTNFGLNSLEYEHIFKNPVVGFVAGFDFDDLGKAQAKVISGQDLDLVSDKAVAIHIQLPTNKIARAEIFNLDTIQPNSVEIVFPKTSFTQSECTINGIKANLAEYLTQIQYKEKAPRPLIANTNGALINRDIKNIDLENKEVSFFSPLYEGDTYYLANIINDYQADFNERLKELENKPVYCSICVSYYLLGNLENKNINIEGAFAFGEIAFQLLNKTLVFLQLDTIDYNY